MPSPEETRIARTESAFRHVNERINEAAQRFDSGNADFVCECADPECHDQVDTPLETYEDVRSRPTTFLVAKGHEIPAYEHVRRRGRGYLIVEKVGRSLKAALRRSDPRAESA